MARRWQGWPRVVVAVQWADRVVEALSSTRAGSTFPVEEFTGWAGDLIVEVAGCGVVSHAGAVALRALADRSGLTAATSRPLNRRGFVPVHDRGRVLTDTAVMIAAGGRVGSQCRIRAREMNWRS